MGVTPDSIVELWVRTLAKHGIRSFLIFDCLHKLDGGKRYTLHQSIFFFVSARTDTHLDRVTLDTVPRGRSFTVWVPLDPVVETGKFTRSTLGSRRENVRSQAETK